MPASVLAEWESRYLQGKCIGDYFDLIVGTSTGGIIALALSVGIPASKILKIYIDHGVEIFPPVTGIFKATRKCWQHLRSIRHYQYERAPLEKYLSKEFEKRLIGDSSRRLCVPSFDGAFGEVHIFKTPHHSDYKKDWKELLVTAALATSAAPTFFTSYKEGYRRFSDGGIWANNPVMVGLVDVLTCHAISRRQIQIVSLGCAETGFITTEKQVMGGMWQWRDIISAAMHLASQNALGQAGLLVGKDHLIRVDAPQSPLNSIQLDDYLRAKSELPSIASELASNWGDEVRDRFLFSSTDPYEAFYGPRAA